MRKFTGILFDMDGVLLDSEEYICQAAIAYFTERGVAVSPEDFLPFVGAGENRYIGGVAEKYGIAIPDITEAKRRTYELYAELVHGRLKPYPGVVEFIDGCRERGLAMAVATSADRTKMEINLHETGLDHSSFSALINGLDLERKKPFPDIYLMAARQIGCDITSCIVFEDAVNGVQAAKAAGAYCIGILSGFPAGELLAAGADEVVPDFNSLLDFAFLDTILE